MLLAHLQRLGHRPLVIVGGGTGLIGDPSGKTTQRPMLTQVEIGTNMAGLQAQFGRFLDFSGGRALLLNNADWLLPLGYVDFLRDIGRHFTVNQMLQHETYRDRLNGEGLSFIEFNYVLLQAYDFLHLYREYGCLMQIGGADQWFNIMAGRELVRRVADAEVYGLVAPLITTSTGGKMGKTEMGAVWLDAARTSPFDYFQYWINSSDADVERFLRLFSFLPLDEIARLGQLQGEESRIAKDLLAFEATRLCHGEEAAVQARDAARAIFGGEGAHSALPTAMLPRARFDSGVLAVDLFVASGLCASVRDARRLIAQGGASINGERVAQADRLVDTDLLVDDALILQAGKKRVRRVVAV
jgi:tyrosyl-tRNA synthetase